VTVPRRRVLRELAAAGVLPQVTRWPPVFAGWLMCAGVLAWKADDAEQATVLRIVAVLLAASVVSLVDDDAANLLAPTPVPLAWRYGVRLGLAAAAVAAPWAIALLWVRPGNLAGALTLECAALTAFGLAVASGVARWADTRDAGLAAGPAVLGAAFFAVLLPSRWALFAVPGDGWRDAHLRWAVVLAGALAVLALTLRDPARRRIVSYPGLLPAERGTAMTPQHPDPDLDERLAQVTVGAPIRLDGPVTLVEYDPEWPRRFAREADRIRAALGDAVLVLEHAGSTSVPGLVAKPIVDIVLAVADSAEEATYAPALEAAGYELRIREPEWEEHRVFKTPDQDVNLHVFTIGSGEIDRMLLTRDRLRADTADRELYARTKRELAQRQWRYVQEYADAKTAVIDKIIARARAAGGATTGPTG